MSALERLKEKVEHMRENFVKLEEENASLKKELEAARQNSSSEELEELKKELIAKDDLIATLRQEIENKDAEIEAIISKVEALLD